MVENKKPDFPFGAIRNVDDGRGESQAERIRRISNGIKVNKETSSVSIESPTRIVLFNESEALIEKSGIRRVIDLCCGYNAGRIGREWINGSSEKRLLKRGIEEYVGVDVAVPEDYRGEFIDRESQKILKYSYKKSEALLY